MTLVQEQELEYLKKRGKEMCLRWKIGNYVIAKCGSEVKFIELNPQDPSCEVAQKLNFNISSSIWL